MSRTLTASILPLYLLLAIFVGGSAQAVWGSLLLQLAGVGLIGWALLGRYAQGGLLPLNILLAAVLLLPVVHLLPLPPEIWTAFPGRDLVTRGFALLGQPLPWLPISLAPYATIATALALIPPVATFFAMQRLGAFRSDWLAFAIIGGGLVSLLLGTMQVSAGGGWYLFELTNRGAATGFFANANHLATLLISGVPFVAAAVASRSLAVPTRVREIRIIGVFAVLLLLAGIVLTGSLAGLLLFGIAAASSLFLFPLRNRARGSALGAAAAIGIATVAAASTLAHGDQASISTRQEIWTRTAALTADYLPVGTGLGTFRQIYQAHEDPGSGDRVFVNRAHNDYLELALEGGVAAVALIVAFLAWWARTAFRAWRTDGDVLIRAATITSGVILAHSIVDYPLRTSAISVLFAACVALMAGARPQPRIAGQSGRETRHLVAR